MLLEKVIKNVITKAETWANKDSVHAHHFHTLHYLQQAYAKLRNHLNVHYVTSTAAVRSLSLVDQSEVSVRQNEEESCH